MNKLYISPEFEITRIEMDIEVLDSSVEKYSSYIDGPSDWGDPIIDTDEDIQW